MVSDASESENVNHSGSEIPDQGQNRLQRQLSTRAQAVAVTAIILVLVSVLALFFYSTPEPRTLNKETLKNLIIKAIENGADLRAVKQIYSNREQLVGWGIIVT